MVAHVQNPGNGCCCSPRRVQCIWQGGSLFSNAVKAIRDVYEAVFREEIGLSNLLQLLAFSLNLGRSKQVPSFSMSILDSRNHSNMFAIIKN